MSRRNMNSLIGVTVACTSFAFAAVLGCKSQPVPDPGANAQANPANAPAPGAGPANPFMASVERAQPYYAKGYNELTSVVEKTLEGYERAVGDVNAPRTHKPLLLSLIQFDEKKVEEAAGSFAEGKKVLPVGNSQLSDPADRAVVTARAILKDYKDAAAYYSAEKYKDDQGALGKEIHARMTSDAETYKAAIALLDEALKVIEQKQAMEELRIHSDPSTYGHQFRAFNIPAAAFMNADDAPGALDRAYSDLDTAYKKVKAFADSKGPTIQATFSGYMTQVDNFYAQAAVVQRNIQDKADEKKMNRDFDLLVTRYNNLIQLTNSLYKIEGSGVIR